MAPSIMNPEVIYEDPNIIVVNKPAGMQVHPARVAASKKVGESDEPTLTDWLVARYPEIKTVGDDPAQRPGIVHRLDKATSGVMVIARTAAAFKYLKNLFQSHEIKKTYLAVVQGVPKYMQGTIDAPIGIRSGTLKRSMRSTKMAKPAVTDYRVKKVLEHEDGKFSLLEVHPKTGRTHQIRVHLASIGHPIIGDQLYGRTKRAGQGKVLPRLMLHAWSLEFTAPDGRRMKFEAEPPQDFTQFAGS